VEDSEDLRLYMDQNGYDNMIRVGEFQIPRDASYEEIAQILTRSAQN
jgi:cell division protein YceG involved in septum cleavage